MKNSHFHFYNAVICVKSISWNKAAHSARFKTLIDPWGVFTQVKLPWKQVTLATCVQDQRKSFVKMSSFFFCIAPSAWPPFHFHVHKCRYSTAPFGNWLSAGQIMIKIRSHTYCNCCCLLFGALCHVFEPERDLKKMPLWVLLIFKRVDW